MRVIAKSRLRKYWEKSGNEQAERWLAEWFHFCKKQTWTTPQEVKDTLSHVSFVGDNRIIFNIKGNSYRVICAMDYSRQSMFIKFVGTHAEYDAIDVEVVK